MCGRSFDANNLDELGDEIDGQTMSSQPVGSDENLVAVNERGIGAQSAAVERKIDLIGVFLDVGDASSDQRRPPLRQ